jgi:hypothetical protein
MLMSTHIAAQVTPIPPADFLPIEAAVTNIGPSAQTVLIQKSYTLQQNEMRVVFGRAEIYGKTGTGQGHTNYAESDVECTGPNGFVAEGDAGQNYEGPHKGAGPDYPTTGHLALYPSVLVQAPTTGTYVCQLLASTDYPETVVGRPSQGDNTTWLRVSAPIATGGGLREAARLSGSGPVVPYAPFSDALSWGPSPDCSEIGLGAGCLYLGPGALPSVDVFLPQNPWSPVTNAAFVDVTASLQATLCGKTSSCAIHKNSDTTSVVIDSHLELIQLNATRGVCKETDSPTQRSTIGNAPHHYMIYHTLTNVAVYPACGAPQFVVKLFVKWVSGSTVKIDGPGATHAIGYTSYHGTANPVPVVVGLAESVARNKVSATGFVPKLSSTNACTDPGNVILQSPTGGTIVLPGSTVDVIVDSATKGTCVPK